MISPLMEKKAYSMTKAIHRLLAALWLLLSAIALSSASLANAAEPRANVDYKLGQGDAIRIRTSRLTAEFLKAAPSPTR